MGENLSPSNIALRIHRNGTVLFSMRRHLVLNCEGDLHIFPFDSPMCTFAIESVSFTRNQMDFHWAGANRISEDSVSGSIALSPVLKRHNAYLIHNETFYCDDLDEWRGDFSCLKVRLHFTRDKAFYWTTVFIPGIILVTSSFVTFWIEWNAVPARVMLGVTTVVNFLARWVQDPDIQKRKRDNAILDSLRIVTTTLDLRHPGKPGTLGAGLLHLDGEFKSKLKGVKGKTSDLAHKFPGASIHEQKAGGLSEDSTVTMLSSCGSKYDEDTLDHGEHLPLDREPSAEPTPEEEPKGHYSLIQVKKIDVYSRRIFPILFFIFVFYFFIRYHAIEGALSIEYPSSY